MEKGYLEKLILFDYDQKTIETRNKTTLEFDDLKFFDHNEICEQEKEFQNELNSYKHLNENLTIETLFDNCPKEFKIPNEHFEWSKNTLGINVNFLNYENDVFFSCFTSANELKNKQFTIKNPYYKDFDILGKIKEKINNFAPEYKTQLLELAANKTEIEKQIDFQTCWLTKTINIENPTKIETIIFKTDYDHYLTYKITYPNNKILLLYLKLY